MSRKQSKYLEGLLGDEKEPGAPTQERAKPTTLLNRASALARVQSGEVKQVTQLELDPSRVKVWPGNARRYDSLTEENCADLLDALVAENGQKIPAVVRRITNDPHADYEVIAGTRRHWAVKWLRAHSYPDFKFLAQVHNLDDEAAFRLADIENRSRKDVSDIERARNYLGALEAHYGGKQRRMAERLKVSEGWLSKMLKVAALPDSVLDAFNSLEDVLLKPAYELAKAYEVADRREKIDAEAKVIVFEQQALKASGKSALAGPDVLRRLLKSTAKDAPAKDWTGYATHGKTGRVALSVENCGRQGITFKVHSGSGESAEDLAKAFREVLEKLQATGIIVN